MFVVESLDDTDIEFVTLHAVEKYGRSVRQTPTLTLSGVAGIPGCDRLSGRSKAPNGDGFCSSCPLAR